MRNPLIRCLSLLLLILAFTAPAKAASLVETDGIWFVASPQFFGSADSGTYYSPTAIEEGGYVFLITQGGQFGSTGSPVSWCGGDHLTLWRAPASHSGMSNGFTPLRRISLCHSNSQVTVHWTSTSALEDQSTGNVLLISERQEIQKSSGSQVSDSVWLLEGSFNAGSSDLPTWTSDKLFDVGSQVSGNRITSVVITEDSTRTPPNDGYLHDLYRGFARRPFAAVVEWRMDISQRYCDDGTSSSPDICALIEFRDNGGWKAIQNGVLDFDPDVKMGSFFPYDVVERGGQKELWGLRLLPGNDCPCDKSTNAGQFRWYVIDPSTFALSGPNSVFSQLRCMPAEPFNYRIGVDLVQVGSTQYLLSGQNDDRGCALGQPFVGQDVVSTVVE